MFYPSSLYRALRSRHGATDEDVVAPMQTVDKGVQCITSYIQNNG